MSDKQVPTISFAQWCERQGVQPGFEEGQRTWWISQLAEANTHLLMPFWTDEKITACDMARVVLRLPDRHFVMLLPGCSMLWHDTKIWGRGISEMPFTTTHDEARAVLRFYGGPGNKYADEIAALEGGANLVTNGIFARKDPDLLLLERRVEALERWEAMRRVPQMSPPTDAELLAELRAELGEGWGVDHSAYGTCWVERRGLTTAFVPYSTLHKHGAPVIAECLRKLAGVDA